MGLEAYPPEKRAEALALAEELGDVKEASKRVGVHWADVVRLAERENAQRARARPEPVSTDGSAGEVADRLVGELKEIWAEAAIAAHAAIASGRHAAAKRYTIVTGICVDHLNRVENRTRRRANAGERGSGSASGR